ncbi:MAG: hypothetical protein KIS78_22335 [Labilithrix sp.]|nr:hypothetical protein [Labilithrix sp.]
MVRRPFSASRRPSQAVVTMEMDLVQTAEELAAMIGVRLDRRPDSPERRTLEGELWMYRKTLNRWQTVPPSDDQLRALLDLLEHLEARVR